MKTLLCLTFAVVTACAFADGACCSTKKETADEKFLRVAQEMLMASEGKSVKKACCAAKVKAGKAKACCSIKSAPKKPTTAKRR